MSTIYVFGTSSGVTVGDSDWLNVLNSATAVDTTVLSGGSMTLQNAANAIGTTISSGGRMLIRASANAIDTVISDGGSMEFVEANASASGTTIESGGSMIVSKQYTTIYNTTISSGGYLEVLGGADFNGITLHQGYSGSTNAYTQMQNVVYPDWVLTDGSSLQLANSYSALNTTVLNGTVHIGYGGIASNTTASGGVLFVKQGGTLKDATIYQGCTVDVREGAIVSDAVYKNWEVASGDLFKVSAGFSAMNTTISALGSQYIYSGGIASNTTVLLMGYLNVDGGSAYNVTVSNNGTVHVLNGGTLSGATIYQGGEIIPIGEATISDAVYKSWELAEGKSLDVYSGFIASDTILSGGGSMTVFSSGSADNTIVSGGGSMIVSSGGSAGTTTVSRGGYMSVDGGTASNTTVASGGEMEVYDVGIANDTTVSSGGSLTVLAYGTLNGATIYQGGTVTANAGAIVTDAVYRSWVLDGDDDTLRVNSGFIASDTTISSGGYVYVSSGGRLKDAMIYQGGWADAEEGAEVSNAVIQGWDMDQSYIFIRSGFIASDTKLKDFASIYVSSGGSAVNTTVMSGGQLVVSSGGTVRGAVVYNGGSATIYTGAVLSDFVYSGLVHSINPLNIRSGMSAVDTTVTGGYLIVSSGGTVTGTVMSGGSMILSGGTATDTTVDAYMYMRGGTATSTTVNRYMYLSSGTATSTTVTSGGSMRVYDGAVADDTTVLSGGYASGFHLAEGQQVNVEVAAGTYVEGFRGNSMFSLENGTAWGFVLYSGGWQKVLEGGTTINTTVSSGAVLTLEDGAAAGGTVTLGGSMVVNGAVAFAEGTVITLDVSARSASDGWMVTGLTALPNNVSWTLNVAPDQAAGTYRLVEGFGDLGNISLSVDGTAVGVNGSAQAGGLWYALTVEDGGLRLTAAAEDPLTAAPEALAFTADDAQLNTAQTRTLAEGVTVTDDRFVNGVFDTGYGTFTLDSGSLSFTQTAAYSHAAGEDSAAVPFSFDVTNRYGFATTQDVTVTIADTAPVISVEAPSAAVPSCSTVAGTWSHGFGADVPELQRISVNGHSLKTGGGLPELGEEIATGSVSITTDLGTLEVSDDGTYTYAAAPNASGSDSFTFAVTDADGDTATADLDIMVEDSTVKPEQLGFSTGDGLLNTPVSMALASGVNITPAAVDTVNAQIAADGGYGRFYLNGGSLVFTQTKAYTHAAGINAVYLPFSFEAHDAIGNLTTQDVTVTIFDTAPSISFYPSGSIVTQGTGVEGTWTYSFGADVPDEKSLSINGVNLAIGDDDAVYSCTSLNGTLTVRGNGTYSYDAASDAEGTDIFEFAITDADGDTEQADLTINVTMPPLKPEALAFSTSDAQLGTAVSRTLAEGVTLTQDAVDAVNAVIAADGGYGAFSLSGNNLVFTQTKAYSHAAGSDSATQNYSFDFTDANGLPTTQDVTVTIADSTPSLSVTAPSASVPSGTTKSGTWSYGFGADVPANKTLTVGSKTLDLGTSTSSVAVTGTFGTLTVKANGTYSYKANPNAAGTDSFAFKITDADNDSKTATLKVTAKDSTVKPAALAYSLSDAKLNTAVSKALASGVAITQAAIDAVNKNISYGKFSLSGRNLVFTQTKAYSHASGASSASQTYSFDVKDANGNATKQDVTLTIADSTPTLSVTALSASVPSGTAKSGTWSYSFGADVPGTKTVTVGGKTLNVGTSTNSVAVAGTYGTLTVKADKTYSYKVKANAAGTDSFAFKIADADGDSKSATLKVTAIDKTAPTVSKITGKANAIGATLQFSEKMDATTLKSALKATFTGTGATATPTAIKETNATSHTYSATFAATNYVGAYKLTLGTGAKDSTGNALAKAVTSSVAAMTVTSKSIASGAYQKIYAGGTGSASIVNGQQLVYSGGKAVKSVINKGGKLVVSSGGTATSATISGGATATVNAGGTATGGTVAGTMTVAGAVKSATVKAGGKLTVKSGATATGMKVSGTSTSVGTMTVAGTASTTTVQAYGQLTVSGGTAKTVTVQKNGGLTLTKGTVNALTLAAGGKVQIDGGKLTGTTTLNGGTMTVAATGVKVAKVTAKTSAVVSYDISKMAAGATTAMLVESTKQALNTGFKVVTAKAQQMGSYKLSSNFTVASKKALTIWLDSTKLGTAKLGSTVLKKNGVSYTVSTAKNVVSLKLAAVAGEMFKGDAKANSFAGTADSDIFYGGKGNDTITGTNGRDVAVYDTTAWGKDTVKATNGTMTLLFAGFKASDVTQKKSGTSLVLTRKSDSSQKVTVQGWNDATHNIVYADTLTAFTKYVNAASPTTKQLTAARTEVWKKAGLAKA